MGQVKQPQQEATEDDSNANHDAQQNNPDAEPVRPRRDKRARQRENRRLKGAAARATSCDMETPMPPDQGCPAESPTPLPTEDLDDVARQRVIEYLAIGSETQTRARAVLERIRTREANFKDACEIAGLRCLDDGVHGSATWRVLRLYYQDPVFADFESVESMEKTMAVYESHVFKEAEDLVFRGQPQERRQIDFQSLRRQDKASMHYGLAATPSIFSSISKQYELLREQLRRARKAKKAQLAVEIQGNLLAIKSQRQLWEKEWERIWLDIWSRPYYTRKNREQKSYGQSQNEFHGNLEWIRENWQIIQKHWRILEPGLLFQSELPQSANNPIQFL